MGFKMVCRFWIQFLVLAFSYETMAELPVKLQDIQTGQVINWKPDGTKKTGIFFVSAHCPCFRNATEAIKKQIDTHQNEIDFVAITSEKNLKKYTKAYYKKLNFNIPIFFDKHMATSKHFEVFNTASVLILGSNDKILYKGGVIEENGSELLGQALKEIQESGETKVPFGKGMGCAIKE